MRGRNDLTPRNRRTMLAALQTVSDLVRYGDAKPVCVHGHGYGLHPTDERPDCDTFWTPAEWAKLAPDTVCRIAGLHSHHYNGEHDL